MKADEYDALIEDPSDYFRRTFLPRIGSAFAPLAGLDSFANMMEASTHALQHLALRQTRPCWKACGGWPTPPQETLRYLTVTGAANADAAARWGYRPWWRAWRRPPTTCWPTLCAAREASSMDRFRQPDKIIEAAERLDSADDRLGRRPGGAYRRPAGDVRAAQGRRRFHVRRRLPHVLLADPEGGDEGSDQSGPRAVDVRRGRLQLAAGGHRRRRDPGGERHLAVRPDRHGRRQACAGRLRLHRRQRAQLVAGRRLGRGCRGLRHPPPRRSARGTAASCS